MKSIFTLGGRALRSALVVFYDGGACDGQRLPGHRVGRGVQPQLEATLLFGAVVERKVVREGEWKQGQVESSLRPCARLSVARGGGWGKGTYMRTPFSDISSKYTTGSFAQPTFMLLSMSVRYAIAMLFWERETVTVRRRGGVAVRRWCVLE